MTSETERNLDGMKYLKLRKLGDHTAPGMSKLMQHDILKSRAKRIAELEEKYPDFKALYDDMTQRVNST